MRHGERSAHHLHQPGYRPGGGPAGAARSLFYETLSQQSGFEVHDDGDLLGLLSRLAQVKREYDKVAGALEEVKETGYGIVVPGTDELVLEDPEIVRQGGRYGVRLKASAPSIHMIRADIETEVSPIVGSEKQSEEMVNFLLQEFEGDTKAIWQSNIFGKSFHELSVRISTPSSSGCRRTPEASSRRPFSGSSTKAPGGLSASFSDRT